MLVALLLAVAASGDDKAAEARLLNGQTIITPRDYPREALHNRQEGTVTARLTVSPSGAVSSCTVVESSGHPALDERTCAIFSVRAKFEPARDGRGRAVEAIYTQRTTWRLTQSVPPMMPRKPWVVRFTVAVAADGSAIRCTVEATGVEGMGSQCSVPAEIALTGEADAEPAGFAITETRFYPVDPDSAPATLGVEGALKVSVQVSRITITPDGQVIACKGILYSGETTPGQDACATGGGPRFEAAPEASGPMVATLVQSAYARRAPDPETDSTDAPPNP